jgi:hypothetical protein
MLNSDILAEIIATEDKVRELITNPMLNSDILAEIIATEDKVRELIKTICDKGDYQSCKITTQIWGLLDQLRFKETAILLGNEQVENNRSTSYHEKLITNLKDPLEAAAYIEVVTEEGDPEMLKKALKNVAEAQKTNT